MFLTPDFSTDSNPDRETVNLVLLEYPSTCKMKTFLRQKLLSKIEVVVSVGS